MATTYDFPEHRKGDTMEAVTFTITVNSVALNLTGASAKMDLRKQGLQKKRYTTTAGDGLTIVAPATDGKLRFDKKVVDIPADTYDYDIQITLSSGDIKTYIAGKFPIVQDITYG